jgi:hypothetical protein
MDDKKLAALARKNAAKAEIAQKKQRGTFDSTLDVTRPVESNDQTETRRIFNEMKKREF